MQSLILISPSLSGFVHSPDFTVTLQRVHAVAPDVSKMAEVVLTAPTFTVVKNSPQRDLMIEMTEHNIKKMFEWATRKSVWPNPRAIERLNELQKRTLFFRGSLDFADSSRIAEHFRAVPDIHFVEIEGGDHKINLTHPEEVFANILSFLETQ